MNTGKENPEIRCTAVLLGAGKGARMGGPIPKQYMPLCGKPLLSWSLKALVDSPVITDIVIVIPAGDGGYVREKVIARVPGAGDKVRTLTPGGAERFLSVLAGLRAITWPCQYVFIHDGARPFIDKASLQRLFDTVQETGAAIAAMPSKDTVKIADENGFVKTTPDRRSVWTIQTPQVFRLDLIRDAYEKLARNLEVLQEKGIQVTDDAMVAEYFTDVPVKLVKADYRNIKVTTPEDIPAAEAFLRQQMT